MNRALFLISLFVTSYCVGQNNKRFVIERILEPGGASELDQHEYRVNPDNIFEDSLYVVSKTCSGEFGGTIKFKNKKTGIVHAAASTCPVTVNKLNGKYYVTNTLDHLAGSSEVLEIDNPDSLDVFKVPPRRKAGKISRYVGDDEFRSRHGTRQLMDSIGVLTLASFVYEGQLYHIVANSKKTFLAQIVNHRFVTIDTVSNFSLCTNYPEVFMTSDKHAIIFFTNEDAGGHLDISGNKIRVIRQK